MAESPSLLITPVNRSLDGIDINAVAAQLGLEPTAINSAGVSEDADLSEVYGSGINEGGNKLIAGTGDYNFAVNEAYMIRDGEIAEPLRGASLVGNGAQDLRNIVGVAGDLSLGQGMCGSISGSLPTDVGQPHILISEITVGGRA